MTDAIGPLRAAVAGRYEIQRQIGQGAFATVYLAHDLRHDRSVAFKVLKADPRSETGEFRFVREIRLLAKLQHPNILPLLDSGHVEAKVYYVMPYVTGESLRQRLISQGQLPLDVAISIAHDAADALAYAHDQGIVHSVAWSRSSAWSRNSVPGSLRKSTTRGIVRRRKGQVGYEPSPDHGWDPTEQGSPVFLTQIVSPHRSIGFTQEFCEL